MRVKKDLRIKGERGLKDMYDRKTEEVLVL